MTYWEAWQKAQDAWVAAGKTIPCYEPKYIAARGKLIKICEGLGMNPLGFKWQ